MNELFDKLDTKEWLALNAKLQTKKNALRGVLGERGILKREGSNTFDRYTYFSEAQYKELFTKLFSQAGLELSFNEIGYEPYEGSEKQPNGRLVQLRFDLHDIDTGFFESTVITGDALDKGDKAGYKAFTGAIKYFLADTFMVATGDDPEKDSPEGKTKASAIPTDKIDDARLKGLRMQIKEDHINEEALLTAYKLKKLEDCTQKQFGNMMNHWDKVVEMCKEAE